MIAVFALVMGVLFGAGLYVAGMTNPAKVQGFLDISGAWDPSLIFVMAAGIPVAWVGYQLTTKFSVGYRCTRCIYINTSCRGT